MDPSIKTDTDLVRHDYGHTQQLKELGVFTYTTTVVIPSVTGYIIDVIVGMENELYYSLPWERQADIMGQANRLHTVWADKGANVYWTWSKVMSTIDSLP